MKFIFDFDDVIFHTTRNRIEHIYSFLEKMDVPYNQITEYYKTARVNCFSLRHMLNHFSVKPELYEKIMEESKKFINHAVFEFIEKISKEDRFIVTYGDIEFNKDKIIYSGAFDLFKEENIFIVQGSKKDIVENICEKYKDEQVVFIDDKEKEFKDLDLVKFPNLKTILYTGQDLNSLIS